MTTEQAIIYQPTTEQKRVVAVLTKEIKSSPNKIFPLACPVEELRWIPDWEYKLIYSESGINETNCIFTEDKSGLLLFGQPITTTWVTNLHDPVNHRILFLLIVEQKAQIRFQFDLKEVGPKVSTCRWQMTFTALDDEANSLSEETIKSNLEAIMGFLSDTLKHYCETGEMLKF